MLPDHRDPSQVAGNLVGGDGADIANVLRHHEVRIEEPDGVGIDLVERAAFRRRQGDLGVDSTALLLLEWER
jgi:hypothetical protein